jgi:Tfp pilus assembly protein PilF
MGFLILSNTKKMRSYNMKDCRSSFIFCLIFSLLFLCYSNTFSVPWHFDDLPNINENYPIHIDNLRPETLWQTFFAKPFSPGTVERPVAFLSFAVNWYIGQDNSFGYHLVNLLIHILTAFFLFKSNLLLLRTHRFQHLSEQDSLFIALLSATIWAVNPVQTQAVTYIVQRMASMAAMFFIFSVYQYIRCRQSRKNAQRIFHGILCLFFFACALGSKENAITLIPSLLLIEFIFFYNSENKTSKYFLSTLAVLNFFVLLAGCYYLIDKNILQTFTLPIGDRPFSIFERALTQPTILLFYLSLLFYPAPSRLSLEHEVTTATSFTDPWTTIPALFIIFLLIAISVLKYKKHTLICFALLFFFINHLIESTVIPLEMIFEHRNYLPSFFLFLPVTYAFKRGIDYTATKYTLLNFSLKAFIPLLIIILGLGTYSRNSVWKTEESLWTDCLRKAPGNARPYARLAEIYGWKKEKTEENFRTALALLQKSLDLESPRTTLKAALVDNIGKLYALRGHFTQAETYYNKSLELNPEFLNARIDLAQALLLQKKFVEALRQMEIIIKQNDQQSRFFTIKTILLLWLDRPQEAAMAASEAMRRTLVNKERYFYNTGVALGRAGHFGQGLWFLRHALKAFPNDRRILYNLIENRLLAGKPAAARDYAARLVAGHSLAAVRADLAVLPLDYAGAPVQAELIAPLILEAARQAVTGLETSAPGVSR